MKTCTVALFDMYGPAGLCGRPAYGEQQGESDVLALGFACPKHGGPEPADVAHEGDPCRHCGTAHDDVPVGPCSGRQRKAGA